MSLNLPLTERQHRVLNTLERLIEARGWPPTQAELSAALEMSKSGVAGHLAALATKGYVSLDEGERRGIKVLVSAEGASVLTPRPIAKTHYCERCGCERCRRRSHRNADEGRR